MTVQRSRKEEKTYKGHIAKLRAEGKQDECPFCPINKGHESFVEAFKYFKVIHNVFPYSVWDGQLVADHLMIVPLKHTAKLGDLPTAAGHEYLKIVDSYEDRGYNLYARAPASVIKSVVHQHTHLIKPTGSRRRFVFFTRKPFIRITF